MTTTTSIMSATPGQIKQITRFGQDAVENAVGLVTLDKDGAQLVIERGDDFQAAVRTAVVDALKKLSVRNEFADEEVSSQYWYPKQYKLRPVPEQIAELLKHFPQLSADKVNENAEEVMKAGLPDGAEGWFAIPRWEKIAPTYNEAVERVLAVLKTTRTFYDYTEGNFGADRLRESERTKRMFGQLMEQQTGDILIIPAQFGKRHAGRSVRRVCAVMNSNEFGLGAFMVGSMLITHPKRFSTSDDLWMDCAGDEYDYPDGGPRWFSAPVFDFSGRVWFVTHWVGYVHGSYGSVSGFLPQ